MLVNAEQRTCLSRLAGDSEEVWLQEEMGVAAESLILSSRNITLVAQKLHLQPECQSHQEELVTTAQHILVDTTKVRLMSELAGPLVWTESSLLGSMDGVCHSHKGCPPQREKPAQVYAKIAEFITNLINAHCGSCHRELGRRTESLFLNPHATPDPHTWPPNRNDKGCISHPTHGQELPGEKLPKPGQLSAYLANLLYCLTPGRISGARITPQPPNTPHSPS